MHGGAERLAGQGGQHLVHVHVRRGARAGLVDVDGKLVVPLARRHLASRLDDGVGDRLVNDLGAPVLGRHRALDVSQSGNQQALDTQPRDGKVVHSPLRLSLPFGLGGNLHIAHGVVLDPVLGHGSDGS